MFRIRRIYDDTLPSGQQAMAQVQEIMRAQFTDAPHKDIASIPEQLRDPLKYRFRAVLFVADDTHGHVKGFALMLHVPDLDFCFLDYMAASKRNIGGGVGSALYERVREEARFLGAVGLFFEALPDDPALCGDPDLCRQNASRLRFYERFGARPIIGTAYETPCTSNTSSPPYLVYDDLGRGEALRRDVARPVVRAILERKYVDLCQPDYIDRVVGSFQDDPVKIRPPRYIKAEQPVPVAGVVPPDRCIALVVNDQHAIHHVRERGYVESPVRIATIMRELRKLQIFEEVGVKRYSEAHITRMHDPHYVSYFKKVCSGLAPGESVYPYVFPIRNATRPPRDLSVRAGYYCIDTFTPLNGNAYLAARRAVDCALTGADMLLEGQRLAYALVRPPGHHAERRAFGGFCYFNSAAIAAQHLSGYGKVAMLDIDYHHGNGHQDMFYDRDDVLVISIHGQPRIAYPFFSGFEDERGIGPGEGYNVNVPLPAGVDGERYRTALEKELRRVARFKPKFLVVPLGLDTAKGDPTGSWLLRSRDFEENGRMIGRLRLPTLVVQEGGYDNRVLGVNARHFFRGLWSGAYGPA